jgi:hypothetical protein
LHLFLLPLLLVITVTFLDEMPVASNEEVGNAHAALADCWEHDSEREYDVVSIEPLVSSVQPDGEPQPAATDRDAGQQSGLATGIPSAARSGAAEESVLGMVIDVSADASSIRIQPIDLFCDEPKVRLWPVGNQQTFITSKDTPVEVSVCGHGPRIKGTVGSLVSGQLVSVSCSKVQGQSLARFISLRSLGSGTLPPGTFVMSPEEKRMMELVNDRRRKNGKKPLTAQYELFQVARAYAALIAKNRRMVDDLDGKDTLQRAQMAAALAGLPPRCSGPGTVKTAIPAMVSAKAATAHNRPSCLVDGSFTDLDDELSQIGIGIANDDTGTVYCYMICTRFLQ